jgi:tape measure domain-containing protein
MRTEGARTFASEVGADTTAVRGLGSAAESTGNKMQRASKKIGFMSSQSRTWSKNMSQASSAARGLSYAVVGMAALAVKSGIQFNAMMESQTVAFTGLLGSSKRAKVYLGDLYDIAKKTPFEFKDVVSGTRTLMAFGANAKDAKTMISDLGNAIAATGASGEAIGRATLALGQIQSAGVLHGQDLNQLINAGVVSVPKISKKMGMSSAQFREDMGKNKITSTKFFKALQDGWEHDPMYRGAAAKQAKTFQGQLSNLHDYTSQTLGSITKPLFESLRKDVLPEMTKTMDEINKIWSNEQLDVATRIKLTQWAVERKLKPLVTAFKQWWDKNDVGGKISAKFETLMGTLANKAEAGAPKVAKAFVNGWLNAGPWTKVATGAWLLTKLGLIGPAAKGLSAMLGMALGGLIGGGKGKKGKGGLTGAAGVVPVFVTNMNGGVMPGTPAGKPGSKWGKVARAATGASTITAGAAAAIAAKQALEHTMPTKNGRKQGLVQRLGGPQSPQWLNRIWNWSPLPKPRKPAPPPTRQAYRVDPSSGRATPIGPTPKAAPVHLTSTVNLQVDGKVLATAVHRQAVKDKARR